HDTAPTALFSLSLHDALPISLSLSIWESSTRLRNARSVSRGVCPCSSRSAAASTAPTLRDCRYAQRQENYNQERNVVGASHISAPLCYVGRSCPVPAYVTPFQETWMGNSLSSSGTERLAESLSATTH